jgi:peptidoglycan/LPS O-acetylase OafA/YrhL
LTFLGEISYGVYLLNVTVGIFMQFVAKIVGLPQWAFIAPAAALTIILSYLGRRIIEVPAQKYLTEQLPLNACTQTARGSG